MQRRDDNELGMMEAVVTKMSRIIAHVGTGQRGKHVVQQLQVFSRPLQLCAPEQQHVRLSLKAVAAEESQRRLSSEAPFPEKHFMPRIGHSKCYAWHRLVGCVAQYVAVQKYQLYTAQ